MPPGAAATANKGRTPKNKKELGELAKAYESQIVQKSAGHEGVVTHIMGGSRMRIKLNHEKILFTFQMQGVKCPNAPSRADASNATPEQRRLAAQYAEQPFGAESLQYAREMLMQQEVRVVIERVDPAGSFIGALFISKNRGGPKNEDLGLQLIKRGLAFCDDWCRSDVYWNAEGQAKKDKLNWWSVNHSEEAEQTAAVQDESASASTSVGGSVKGELISLQSLQDFYLVSPPGKDREMKQMIVSDFNGKVEQKSADGGLVKKQIYLAQSWEDKSWSRAFWLGRGTEGGKFSTFLIDYGSYMETDEMRKILPGSKLLTEPPACVRCGLYGVRTSNDVWTEACEAFFALSGKGKTTLTGSVEVVEYDRSAPVGVPNQIRKLVLKSPNGDCLNEQLVKESWARLTRREATFSIAAGINYANWKQTEKDCSKKRLRLWRHGCPDSDEDED